MIDTTSEFADNGVFFLTQNSASCRYSGCPCFEHPTSGLGVDFKQRTGLLVEYGIGNDTSLYRDQ